MEGKTYFQMLSSIEKDPSASYFLKDMAYEAERRDPVDVIRDCETLIALMQQSMLEAREEQCERVASDPHEPRDCTYAMEGQEINPHLYGQ
jgi:hypothetical protein